MTKKHTHMLYGIAIAMMLYHHLFCIPSRLNCNYFSVLGNIELKLAWFCRICVAVYAFITGYGLCKSSPTKMETNLFKKITQDYKFILKHLFQFMKKYWIVFVFFVPIRMIVNPPLITPKSFIMSLFGLDYTYNGEWWYIKKYIVLLILFPILNACFILLKDKKLKIIRNSVVIGITLIVVIEVLFYRVNINTGEDLYTSPVYYLQQNDVVYVEPNSVRARQSTVNGNNVRSTSFWISLASLLTTITVLIVK